VTLAPDTTSARAADTLARAAEWLLADQHPDGYWKGELETNVTIEAEDVFMRVFLGNLDPTATEATARWIRGKQRSDGTWATFHEGPADLSTTVEAYLALRIAGDEPELLHMQAAASYIREGGGVAATRVFTRMWLSLLSLWSWSEVPMLAPEQILLPSWAPLNVYSFACWARQTIVPLSIVCALRPSVPAPVELPELRAHVTPPPPPATWSGRLFVALDRALHRYARHPIAPLRRLALAKAERWVIERQEADGSWGGIQPPWVWSIIALHARGHALDSTVVAKALRGLDDFTIEDERGRRIEACQSPVWDTALALIALADAGVPSDHDAVRRATAWIAAREITYRGDWTVRRPKLPASGFAFEFANDCYPDIDDTAVVALALLRSAPGDRDVAQVAARGRDWVVGMQSRGGGWAAFDVDNTSSLCALLPFCDFGAVTDPPSADVTAHVVELLGHEGLEDTPAARAGIEYLLREQEPDGSWFGRWGANYIYGTGAVVPALAAVGLRDHPSVSRAVAWLESVQNDDGGFGEDLRSYRDRRWSGRGTSTASQTAWALLALHAAGGTSPAIERAVAWLADTQRPDGGWDEDHYTGTGFPGDFYLNYHLYRNVFPVAALGRIVGAGDTSA
jgi:squalene-hopene/tetraprenyl-beta-curcumene cyclase